VVEWYHGVSTFANYFVMFCLFISLPKGDFPPNVKEELINLRDNLARSGTETVNWKEFVVAFMDRNIAKREDNIKKVLTRFGKGSKTHLTLDDLIHIFGGEDEAKEIFDYLDAEGKGEISIKDFQKAVEQSLDEPDDDDGAEFDSSDDEFHDG